eukprot:6294423-Karenia_brevis.AAC.1
MPTGAELRSWQSPRKSPRRAHGCDLPGTQCEPKSAIMVATCCYQARPVEPQHRNVESSKYMEKSPMRILRTRASANLDHVLRDVCIGQV